MCKKILLGLAVLLTSSGHVVAMQQRCGYHPVDVTPQNIVGILQEINKKSSIVGNIMLRCFQCTGKELGVMANCQALVQNLESLDLIASSAITDQDVIFLKKFTKLKELKICGKDITDECMRGIINLPNLSHLQIGGKKITGEFSSKLAQLKMLECLIFVECGLTQEVLFALKRLETLKKLVIYRCGITKQDVLRSLRCGMGGFANLEVLAVPEFWYTKKA